MKEWSKKLHLLSNKVDLLIVVYFPHFIIILLLTTTILTYCDYKYIIKYLNYIGISKNVFIYNQIIFLVITIILTVINLRYIDKKSKLILKNSQSITRIDRKINLLQKLENIKSEICKKIKLSDVELLIANLDSPISLNIKGKNYLILSYNILKLMKNKILSDKEAEAIMLHEMYHLKQKDDIRIKFVYVYLRRVIKYAILIPIFIYPIAFLYSLYVVKHDYVTIFINSILYFGFLILLWILYFLMILLVRRTIKDDEILIHNLVVDYQKTDRNLINALNKLGEFQYILDYKS